MADIELVIKIPEELISEIDDENYQSVISWFDTTLYCAIKDGTPLPKGRGRLIDADEAIKTLKSLGSRDYRREKGTIQEAIKMLSFDEYTPTIIEADKEGEECINT